MDGLDKLLAVASLATAAYVCGNGWFQDRQEDFNDHLMSEEKIRIWRIRAWRHQASDADIKRYLEQVGPNCRVVRCKEYSKTFEAALFNHPAAERTLYSRELIWVKMSDKSRATDTCNWKLMSAQFSNLQDTIVLSFRLGRLLGYVDAGGNVHATHREPVSSSQAQAMGNNCLTIKNLTISIAGFEKGYKAMIQDVPNAIGDILLPSCVRDDLQAQRHLDYSETLVPRDRIQN